MKRFICGFVIGAMLFGAIGAFAASYVAEPASFKVMVNGKEFVSDPPALVVEGRTYLPLRAIGDALGVPVEWNAELGQAEVGTVVTESTASVENSVQISDTWKMTFLGCKSYNEIDSYTKARDGKEFVIITFELENITTERQVFTLFNLSSYFDDFKTPLTVIGQQIDGATELGANEIDAGKKIKGYLSYEVEPNWSTIDIIYNDDMFDTTNESAIKFTINK